MSKKESSLRENKFASRERVDKTIRSEMLGYTERMSRTQAYIYILIIVAVVIAAVAVLAHPAFTASPATATQTSNDGRIPQPPLTDAVEAQLAASPDFQDLVSYTDQGFEPATLSIQKGDTVRFTNNSHESLWIAAVGGIGAYPGGENSCGTSALDSCHVLQPGEFWEFTFDVAGTWSYLNNVDKTNTGVVNVQ